MSDRTYCAEILRIWGTDILCAEKLVDDATRNPAGFSDLYYLIKLDPEDFLELCAGKWHPKVET